jgi:hypothetical protein
MRSASAAWPDPALAPVTARRDRQSAEAPEECQQASESGCPRPDSVDRPLGDEVRVPKRSRTAQQQMDGHVARSMRNSPTPAAPQHWPKTDSVGSRATHASAARVARSSSRVRLLRGRPAQLRETFRLRPHLPPARRSVAVGSLTLCEGGSSSSPGRPVSGAVRGHPGGCTEDAADYA